MPCPFSWGRMLSGATIPRERCSPRRRSLCPAELRKRMQEIFRLSLRGFERTAAQEATVARRTGLRSTFFSSPVSRCVARSSSFRKIFWNYSKFFIKTPCNFRKDMIYYVCKRENPHKRKKERTLCAPQTSRVRRISSSRYQRPRRQDA